MKLILLLSLCLSSISCSLLPTNPECLVTRAAFDVGSGSTKMKVAQVNHCEKTLVKVLHKESKAVAYKEAISSGRSKRLGSKIIAKGAEALNDLKGKATELGATEYYAVATSVFRTAKNGAQAASSLKKSTGIDIKVISQKEEAKLGYYAVKNLVRTDTPIISWDIGGGSMQIMTENDDGNELIYFGKKASVSFKDDVLVKLQKRSTNKSPNPMGKDTSLAAFKMAESFAKNDVPINIKNKIQKTKKAYGIGGVHYYSLRKQVGSAKYDVKKVKESFLKRSKLNDKEIATKYAKTDITNLVLVAGFMSGLGIEEVETLNINLTDFLLVAPEKF